MITQEDEPVSLRIDHQNFEEESGKEDGSHDKETREILKNPDDGPQQKPSKFHGRWDKIFLILCELAVFLDPLYCFFPSTDSHSLCYFIDMKLMIIFFFTRSALDLFYGLDAFIFARRIFRKLKSTVSNRKGFKPVMVAVIYKLSLAILRIFVALPIPQATILTGYFSSIGHSIPLLLVYAIQYSRRAYDTYHLMKKNRRNIETEIGRWLGAILDFIPFVIAAHLFGSVWYYFSIDRELHCWTTATCVTSTGTAYDLDKCRTIQESHNFYCPGTLSRNMTLIREVCSSIREKNHFNFGIYAYALESGVTRKRFHIRKVVLCFWWGLRNLSSFGSDLKTTIDMKETILSIMVSISGMVLFLVYLNASVQELQKRSEQLKLSLKMKMAKPVIDFWLWRKGLPKCLNKVISRKVEQELRENRHVDLKDFLALLPHQHRDTMYQLRLASLKKVPKLEDLNERVLKAVCKHLEVVSYPKNCRVIHVGEQLWNMLFITQGTLLSHTTSIYTNVCGASTSSSSSSECLRKGDFCGEELVSWAFSFGTFSELPVSTKNIVCMTPVEAFSISASSWETIVSDFRIYFSRKFPPQDHYHLENLAACCIQDAWRRHYARSQAS